MNPLRLLARWLFRKFGLERRGTSVYGYVEGGFSIFINLILFLIKFVMGQRTESIALKADSFHTLGDVATSLIIVIGFFIALRPADQRHPFGHGRTERIIAIVIATLLCVVAYEFFAGSLIRFLKPQPVRFSWLAIFILTVSIILKEMLTIFSLMLFQTSGYQSLKADAWHHRSDSLATALVLIGFLILPLGQFRLDGLLGMVISILIAATGIQLIVEAGSLLLGEAPHPELENNIRSILQELGIQDVHHIHVHDYSGRQEITLHIRLPGATPLNEAHTRATHIERAIKDRIKNSEVTVHCEPQSLPAIRQSRE